NSGAALVYLAPDNTSQTIANDTWDLWSDTTEVFKGVTASSANQSLSDLKFVFHSGYGTIKMDNFSIRPIEPVPEPAATGLLAAGFIVIISSIPPLLSRLRPRIPS